MPGTPDENRLYKRGASSNLSLSYVTAMILSRLEVFPPTDVIRCVSTIVCRGGGNKSSSPTKRRFTFPATNSFADDVAAAAQE